MTGRDGDASEVNASYRTDAVHPFDEVVTSFIDGQPGSGGFSARELTDAMPQMVWSTRPDGHHDYFNLQWYAFTGVPVGSTDGEAWAGMFHPDDQARTWSTWRHSLATGDPYEIEYRVRHHSGDYRWTLGRALPIRDSDGRILRWIGTCTDINDRKLGERQRELLTLEMGHRVTNLFAVVSALIALEEPGAASAADLSATIRSKIAALAATHALVSNPAPDFAATREATLHAMLGSIVAPYQSAGHDRIVIGGDDHAVGSESATALALIFHELATNAVKYGALSVPSGGVAITTTQAGPVTIEWRERGGPALARQPTRKGFGTRLTEATLAKQLGGTIERVWGADGLLVSIRVDPARLSRAPADRAG